MHFLLLSLVTIAAAQSTPLAPSWNTIALNPFVSPYGGAKLINGTTWTRLYLASPEVGQYAMSPMISFLNSALLATWKVSPVNEDQAGQNIHCAQSTDGVTWAAGGKIFPSMNSTENPGVALFAEPSLYLNGHVYAAASPKQFCLYPDQYQNLLLLRRVLPGSGNFGPVFWAATAIPQGYAEASRMQNVTTVLEQDADTQSDILLLTPNQMDPPCSTGSTKCEFCAGGCQDWKVAENVSHMENERTHYNVPSSTADVILYRTRDAKQLVNYLYYSSRASPQDNWTYPVATNITDDVANINAGILPDGRVYLLSNVMPNVFRDPMFISLSGNGYQFTSVGALGSCEDVQFTNPRQPLGCVQRYSGGAIEGGLQYPQAVAVTAAGVEGFYAILSQNKEDIWVSRTPFSSFDF